MTNTHSHGMATSDRCLKKNTASQHCSAYFVRKNTARQHCSAYFVRNALLEFRTNTQSLGMLVDYLAGGEKEKAEVSCHHAILHPFACV